MTPLLYIYSIVPLKLDRSDSRECPLANSVRPVISIFYKDNAVALRRNDAFLLAIIYARVYIISVLFLFCFSFIKVK